MDFFNLQKATIRSYSVGYGPRPNDDEEVEQRLTISRSGRVWFSSYAYNEVRLSHKQVWVGQERATELLRLIGLYFASCVEICLATDIGTREMRLWDTAGESAKFEGSLCCAFEVEGRDLSTLIREGIGMSGLFLYDGDNE